MSNTKSSPPPPPPAHTPDAVVADARAVDISPVLLDVRSDASLLSRVGVEILGTFALVLVTLGAALYLPLFGVDAFGIAITAGLALAGLTVAFGHVSGGHFNPAVTFAAALAGRIRLVDLVLYWLAQVLGGIVAGVTLLATIPAALPGVLRDSGLLTTEGQDARGFMESVANGWGEASPLSVVSGDLVEFDLRAALVLEVVAVAALVAVVLGSASRRAARAAAPFAVGATYAVLLMITAPATGGALNPARATAAAVFSTGPAMSQLWLFWVAPLLAAAVVGLAYLAFSPVPQSAFEDFEDDEDDEDDEEDTAVTP